MSEVPLYCTLGHLIRDQASAPVPFVTGGRSGQSTFAKSTPPDAAQPGEHVAIRLKNVPPEVSLQGTSLTRRRTFLGPYRRPVPRVQGGS